MQRCLYCYGELKEGQTDFHPACSGKIFGVQKPPEMSYSSEHIEELAHEIIRSQVAVTGVQPKISLDLTPGNDPSKRFTIVGLWGRYILKPQTELYRSLPELEDLTLHLAGIAKIQVVPHSLIRMRDGKLAYITKRIDRDDTGGKIAMEDMCQLAERLTEYKYKGSYEQIAKLILKYSATPKLDVINFWEQAYFCWLTGNADMHLKNFSLYAPTAGNYRLTPAYDMVATNIVIPEDREELALTLNGKKRKINRSDFEEAMSRSGLDEKVRTNIFSKFQKSLPQWREFIGISFIDDRMKAQYIKLIETKLLVMRIT
jgi:serine/threonine-protein kinase HipA